MRALSKRTTRAASAVLILAALSPRGAAAVELIPKLDCALTQTTHTGKDYCLKVFNTCNTPIVSRIEAKGGAQTDSAEIKSGERGSICSPAPFAFLGHYITGPLAQGAGD